jgi:hypothetical protein
VLNWAAPCKVVEVPHSLPTVHRLLFSAAANSHNETGSRIESDASSCWLGAFTTGDAVSAWEDGSLKCSQEKLLDDILVLTRDGRVEQAADAYLFVARRIWWARPFYATFHLPPFNGLLWRGYRWFNRNRYRISRHCPFPQQANSGDVMHDRTHRSPDQATPTAIKTITDDLPLRK